MKECCKECYCCKACGKVYNENFHSKYTEKAKAYVDDEGFNSPYSVYVECNNIAKEVYKRLNPEKSGYNVRIQTMLTSDAEVDRLFSIFCTFVDAYREAIKNAP